MGATCWPVLVFAAIQVEQPAPPETSPGAAVAAAEPKQPIPSAASPIHVGSLQPLSRLELDETGGGIGRLLKILDPSDETPKDANARADRWGASFPKGTGPLCMAGVCLGDAVDELPEISNSSAGVRVKGVWHLGWSKGMPDAALDRHAKNLENIAIVQRMSALKRACSARDLADGLKPRMRLTFTPDDGSLGGIDVIAEVIPKGQVTVAATSAYAITQINMRLRRANPNLAVEWPTQVATLWPGLHPFVAPATPATPETIVMWSTEDALKTSDALSNIVPAAAAQQPHVRYSVRPLISIDDAAFNRSQWNGKPVVHSMQWMHGLKAEFALAQQKACNPDASAASKQVSDSTL